MPGWPWRWGAFFRASHSPGLFAFALMQTYFIAKPQKTRLFPVSGRCVIGENADLCQTVIRTRRTRE